MENRFKYFDEFFNNRIDECTIVTGVINDERFLFKNRDRSFKPEHTVIREKIEGTEIVYYSDQTGWFEGMNEHGVGFAASLLTKKEWKGYKQSYTVTEDPKPVSLRRKTYKRYNKIYDTFRKILLSKNAKDVVKMLEKSTDILRNNSIIVSDSKETYEIELFKESVKHRKLDLVNKDFYVKSNHGELFQDAGHKQDGFSLKRGISRISQHQASVQLQGTTDIMQIPDRMKIQVFDPSSSLNVFRTDDEENTTSQCMMNLTKLEFYFYHDKTTAKSIKFVDNVKDPVIKVQLIKT